MADDTPDHGPGQVPGDAAAGWSVLDAQRARMEALRKALIEGGAAQDDSAFDYATFFTGERKPETPEG